MHQPASINLTFQSNKYEALWSIICGFKDNIECMRVLVVADTNTPFPSQHSSKVSVCCLLSDAAAKVCQNHELVTGVWPTATVFTTQSLELETRERLASQTEVNYSYPSNFLFGK